MSRMNGLQPFERIIEQTVETTNPSSKTITASVMTTNRIQAYETSAATLLAN